MERRIYHFGGRVQGVGFRYTAQALARMRPLQGFVRNLDNGRVEMIVEGDGAEIEALLQEIRTKLEGNITRVDVNTAPVTGEFSAFEIRH